METVRWIDTEQGNTYFPICELPEPVAFAWLDYLADERKPINPVSVGQFADIDGEITTLHIVLLNHNYYLITDPSVQE